MIIKIDNHIRIELVEEHHAEALFNIAYINKDYLKEWMPWVENMETVAFIQNFIQGSKQKNLNGEEYAFVIFEDEIIVGRIGVYKINAENRIGEIGYWVIENLQGKGIITKSCIALIHYCFQELNINRIEIKCGVENIKSQAIPERLNFIKEGIIRQGKLVNDHFIDLFIYALLKEDATQLSTDQ